MELRRIFDKSSNCPLWSVCFDRRPEDGKWIPVFRSLLNQWADTEFLEDFFETHKDLLADGFWKGLSVDNAITQVLNERRILYDELQGIARRSPGYESRTLADVFEPLHKGR